MHRVLVADDDPPLRGLIEVVLLRHGLHIDAVADGAAAIEKLRTTRYEALVLDLMMPRASGYDVIAHIEQMTHRPAVIVVTAMETMRYLDLKSDVVTTMLRKPFDIELFGTMIAEVARAMNASHVVPHAAAHITLEKRTN